MKPLYISAPYIHRISFYKVSIKPIIDSLIISNQAEYRRNVGSQMYQMYQVCQVYQGIRCIRCEV